MPSQTFIWTALPNGVGTDGATQVLRLSVLVAPRLQPDPGASSLSAFRDLLQWPARMQPDQVSFAVQVKDARAPVKATITSKPPEPELWAALVDANTFVRGHQFDDWAQRPISSYPASKLHQHLRSGYQQIHAAAPVNLPTGAHLAQAYPTLHAAFNPALAQDLNGRSFAAGAGEPSPAEMLFRLSAPQSRAERIAATIAQSRGVARASQARIADAPIPPGAGQTIPVVANAASPADHFAQLAVFHHRDHPAAPAATATPDSTPPDQVDFHQLLAALGEYPQLLRRLGLVIDLEVLLDTDTLPPAAEAAPRLLQVLPTWSPVLPGTTNYSPWTAYGMEPERFFRAAPTPVAPGADGEIAAGLLNLHNADPNDPVHDVVQIDLDGAALKTIGMAATTAQAQPSDAPQESAMPALRAPGVGITRAGHADRLNQRFNNAHNNNLQLSANPPQLATLFAEDLVRGYRVDVRDAGTWRSLHARVGVHQFLNHPGGALPVPIEDEGWLQPGVVTPPAGATPTPDDQVYIHESLFSWKGWSLAAPHPGKSIGNPHPATGDTPAQGEQPEATLNQATTAFKLETTFGARPGSLPHLRFGRPYQFRIRLVDLAGNGLSMPEADAVLEFEAALPNTSLVLPETPDGFTFRRFEPVSSPVVVLREKLTAGESAERLVIRSNFDSTAAAYAAAHPPFGAVNERHIVPPKTSQMMAELFGKFDSAFGPGGNPQAAYAVARKEQGTLNDEQILNTATGQMETLPAGSLEFVTTGGAEGYTLHHEARLRLPYLPDPLARGATLRHLPGLPSGTVGQVIADGTLAFQQAPLPAQATEELGSVTQIPFGTDAQWPDLEPFRLQVAEGDGRPAWDGQGRVLTVFLRKGERRTVRLSSHMDEKELPLLGVWQWMADGLDRQAPPGADPQALERARELFKLAHVGAHWMLTPFRELTLVHAVQQPVDAPEIVALSVIKRPGLTFAYVGGQIRVHGWSTAKLDLLASWQEPVDRLDEPTPRAVPLSAGAHVFEVPIHLAGDTPAGQQPPSRPGVVPIAHLVEAADPAQDLVQLQTPSPDDASGRFFSSRHEFGDTKYRRVAYQAMATTRFREYFPASIRDDPTQTTRVSAPVAVDVLNSARPAALRMRYALPVFEWSRPPLQPGVSVARKRLGGGVRVYLERPWYSSGEGELLGVVLWQDPSRPPSAAAQPYVTQWGRDPIWRSAPTAGAPAPGNFPRQVRTGSDLTLEELPGVPVTVVGHTVKFSAERALCYCDIKVDAGATYCPFARLALARYQPNSLPDAHLSRVALADMVQLVPDRTVTLAANGPNSFTIQVDGLTYAATAWQPAESGGDDPEELDPAPPLVEVHVEQRLAGSDDVAGWGPLSTTQGIEIQVHSFVTAGENPPPGTPLWVGQVTLPTTRTPGAFRVVIREFEHLLSDRRVSARVRETFSGSDFPDGHPRTVIVTENFFPGDGRLVFADTIVF